MLYWIPLLLIFFCSCTSNKRWSETAIQTGHDNYNSERLVYTVDNPFREVEIEVARIDELTTIFLNVHSGHIPALEGDSKKAAIHIKTHDREITLIADRLEGGQRLKLPPLASKHLIDALFSSNLVTLTIDPHYETSLDTTLFKAKYKIYKRGDKK